MPQALIPVILSGGAGSRLWPVSRESHPKPFIQLSDGQSLLQKTFCRAAKLANVDEILTVTNRELLFKTNDEYRQAKLTSSLKTSYILEPFGRNTAAAIAIATIEVSQKHGKDALMLILPADHLIADEIAFGEAVDKAMELANQQLLVTFGIKPDCPETGYGYIEAEGHSVLRFVEKPSLEKAQEYLESGRFLWNSGMFCFTANTMIKAMETCCPEILFNAKSNLEQSRTAKGMDFEQIELEMNSFALIPEDSIDCAVFEKHKNTAVVPCSIGWSDIGSWNALGALNQTDADGNSIEGETILHDVKNCYIRSTGRLTAAVGVDNLFIIDTPDALLVADKSRAQEVKRLYNQLKAQDHEAHKLHRTVHRPWGTYTVLEEGPHFKIKRIEVRPGGCLSLQMHYHRSEHWIVVTGMAKITNGENCQLISTNESTYIPAGHKHRLENPGVLNLVMIEVQCGQYLGEDDIVRFEDSYGRT